MRLLDNLVLFVFAFKDNEIISYNNCDNNKIIQNSKFAKAKKFKTIIVLINLNKHKLS